MPDTPANSTSWTGYRVSLPLAAPVHIGWRTVGNLKQTRPYAPGSAIWGALATRIARDRFANQPDQYHLGRISAHNDFRFTYLYPSESPESVDPLPWGRGASQFEWLFLNSYMSTALRDGRSAAPGLLHEIEYIAHVSRAGKPVYLVGYCWVRSGAETLNPESLWSSLQIGGERTYGFGAIRRNRPVLRPLTPGELLFGVFTPIAGENPILRAEKDHDLWGHVVAATAGPEASYSDVRLEPFVGRQRTGIGTSEVWRAKIAYAPGTRRTSGIEWNVGEWGIWTAGNAL